MYTQMYTFSYSHVFSILICIRPTHAFKNDIYNWKAIYFNDSSWSQFTKTRKGILQKSLTVVHG